MAGLRSIADLPIDGRRVLMRVDFNTPLDGDKVSDDTRIRAALPSIGHALERGARLTLMSHLGRPKGERNPKYGLEPVAARLADLLEGGEVLLADDCIGDGARKVVGDLREGQVALLENLRFHPGEEANDVGFAKELARHGDVYVNDAFGAAHRAHASVAAVAKQFPDRGAGFLLSNELTALDRLLGDAERPFVAVLGGAKVSDKIGVLEALLPRIDALLVGGAMANTFLAARGAQVGASKVEEDKLALARSILAKAEERGVAIELPVDLVVADGLDAPGGQTIAVDDGVPEGRMAVDIGPATVARFEERAASARSVFWNGPMGVFEKPPFAEGTLGVARALSRAPGFSVVGGGDSVAAVQQAGLYAQFGHVSTGGGASLEYLEGRKLPGVEALR